MSIYYSGNICSLFKGDYHPISIYKGSEKIIGWKYFIDTGESFLIQGTYNDEFSLKIIGKTTETGTADKSLDNPYILNSVSNFDLIVSSESNSNSISLPFTLRSLPNGTSDYIEIDNVAKTAKLITNVGIKVFSGLDSFSTYSTLTNTISRSIVLSNAKGLSYNVSETRSNRLARISNISSDVEGYGNGDTTNRLFLRLNKSRLNGYSESWTSLQISAAVNAFFEVKNWIFYYTLLTPTVTQLNFNAISSYYPFTNIYTIAEIKPLLNVTIRTVQ